jgi:7-cyano-7-deazaguanine synthase
VDYGQRHALELRCAAPLARALGVAEHRTVSVDLRVFGGSALTDRIDVPKSAAPALDTARRASHAVAARPPAKPGATSPGPASHRGESIREIPVTYVPARNTIFLALALAYAEVVAANDVFIGANAVDYSGYPDCRPPFLAAFEKLATVATKAGVEGRPLKIHAPLIALSKAEIVREAARLGVDFALTHSCYDPSEVGISCGLCDSCRLRLEGFRAAGIRDPLPYGTQR